MCVSFMVMLAPGQVAKFFEQGYLIVPGFFDRVSVAKVRTCFERLEQLAERLGTTQELDGCLFVLEQQKCRPLRIERIVWCGAVEPELIEVSRTPRLLQAMAQLLGTREIDQLINQAHIKRPGDGVGFPFHQDSYHRRYGTPLFSDVNGRGSFIQSLVAIDPMRPANGGLWVVPGSQRLGHITSENGELPPHSFDPQQALPVLLEAGDLLLLAPFTIHGSSPNEGSLPRRVFINGFCCAGANRRMYPGAGTGQRLVAESFLDSETYAKVV